MNKELKNMLKDLAEIFNESDSDFKKQLEEFKKNLNNALIEPNVEISVKKDKNGKACTCIKGSAGALLVTLAGLEKSILKRIGMSQSMFDTLKKFVDTEEAE